MSTIASKNAYELLGNDPELDPDREPEPPTKAVDHPVQRAGKRNAGAEGPPAVTSRPAAGGRGGRHETLTRGDQAGSLNNRAEQRDDGLRQDRHANRTREPRDHRGGTDRGGRGARGEGRGGRGYSGRFQRTNRDDRQSHSGIGEHQKQAAHGWGDEKDANNELNDEQAGEAMARAESREEPGFTPDTGAGDPAFTNGPGAEGEVVGEDAAAGEPEEKTKSYDEYLAEQAEKRLALGGESLQVRKANEGSKQKFPEGKAINRNTDEENFIAGSGGKARREKTSGNKKEQLALDGQYYAAPDAGGDRGGRGRGRGGRGGRGRGDGEFRGDREDRGDRGDRGDREGRGGGRGGRGEFRGDRGDRGGRGGRGRGEFRGERGPRGNRGGQRGGGGQFNATDQSAFPALGGS
ncbi:hypothetical protein LTR37_012934 [Vermiconidia calcicola]|uniref:Uncharacterized protein n=1 Tax=Vermiconidia calcicola TaxID=1690605 RepID=A0ACC3MZ05_9PEZI|nr:hypothetical protein LTR37_012934 [Vermiconidia calcicola]